MNIKELKNKIKINLKKESYPIRLIHPWDIFKFRYINYFEFKLAGESYCIEENNNIWKVYYTERGSQFNIKEFNTETEACEYFYNWIMQSHFKYNS